MSFAQQVKESSTTTKVLAGGLIVIFIGILCCCCVLYVLFYFTVKSYKSNSNISRLLLENPVVWQIETD